MTTIHPPDDKPPEPWPPPPRITPEFTEALEHFAAEWGLPPDPWAA